ncbi:MAG: PD-(D/E)XK nuclease domain-containing protein, partial [Selenomonadaceae bacterium]|nr:PD-(D/E)XK nuclease domain-containing protein [Selenomonadaceae bacterium]
QQKCRGGQRHQLCLAGRCQRDTPGDSYSDFLEALLHDDVEAMEDFLNDVSLRTFSFFDVGKLPGQRQEPERFYHGFVLGLMVDLRDRYVITSNRESGFGRYDIMLEPRNDSDNAIIIEFKVFRPQRERNLVEALRQALQQIEERHYAAALEAKGIPQERIRKYGFVFEGKRVVVGRGK